MLCEMKNHPVGLVVLLCVHFQFSLSATVRPYPKDFMFGTSTAAYQIEGAWNVDGKSESIWDEFVHRNPSPVNDGTTGDVACNSYYQYKDDVANLKNLGVTAYRLSMAWTRILPNGTKDYINPLGIRYYSDVINELLQHGIRPLVTIYHWDLPQILQQQGGFLSPNIVGWLTDYADVLFQNFGDRVKWWITLNEPERACTFGYGSGSFAPGIMGFGHKEYVCIRYSLLAHASIYHMYQKKYKYQGGKLSMSLDADGCYPQNPDSAEDNAACQRHQDFTFGIMAHPVFSAKGNFPQSVIDIVAQNSRLEGLNESRLPSFTPEEINFIKGTYDFFGTNLYTSVIATSGPSGSNPSVDHDANATLSVSRFFPRSEGTFFNIVPKGMREMLNYIKDHFGNPEIVVTENGVPFSEAVDLKRIIFIQSYLGELQRAIQQDHCRVIGYFAWALMDDFEWLSGYTLHFGLYSVDFNDKYRKRTPRASAYYYKLYIQANTYEWP